MELGDDKQKFAGLLVELEKQLQCGLFLSLLDYIINNICYIYFTTV